MCTYHFSKKKNVEWICGNGIIKIGGKKGLQLVCGNAIAEIGEKKFVAIVAMPLPKMGGKKKNLLPKYGEKFLKKVLRSQYFYNTFTTNHR